MKNKPLVPVAYYDPAHCLAPGLFRTAKRGELKGKSIEVTYNFGEKTSITFLGVALGIDHMRLLQALIAMAGPQKSIVNIDRPEDESSKQLALLLEPENGALLDRGIKVKGTIQALLREMGYKTDGGEKRNDILEGFQRLSTLKVFIREDGKAKSGSNLLSYHLDEDTGAFEVLLNPRMTKAIMGEARYTHIDMREVRALESDPARLLHQHLSAVVDPGKNRRIFLDTLISYVWPEPATGSTLRTRRQAVRAAIAELVATGGWLFTKAAEDGSLFVVYRRDVGYPALSQLNPERIPVPS